MNSYKEKAIWLPNHKKFVKQIIVSFISYLTLPLFRKKNDGIRAFFKKNYYEKPDDLVFDGTSSGYFSRIEKLLDNKEMNNRVVLDLGCGQGSLLKWLNQNSIKFKEYVGIDFAIEPQETGNVKFICGNIENVEEYITNHNIFVFMCNSLCYLEKSTFLKILSSFNHGTGLIIIEPTPNIFWDAHFCGVKPVYRPLHITCKILEDAGYTIISTFQDYYFQFGNFYGLGLSYGIYAIKM